MLRLTRKRMIGMVAVLIATIVAVAFLVLNRNQEYDPAFDAGVTDPAYRDDGPVFAAQEGGQRLVSSSGCIAC